MAVSKDDILEAISNMTVVEVVDLIEAMEEKFGVTAAAPVAAAAAGATTGVCCVASVRREECRHRLRQCSSTAPLHLHLPRPCAAPQNPPALPAAAKAAARCAARPLADGPWTPCRDISGEGRVKTEKLSLIHI